MKNVPEFLSHLRTDRRGIPVPYINRWGPERVDDVMIEIDSNVGGAALFLRDDDQTEPDFLHQSFQRQRECMTQGLCQVCARRVPWSRRFLVLSDMSVENILLGLRPTPAVTEPWLDERCAEFAMQHCPALIRRERDEALTLVPITSKRQVRFAMSRGYVDGPLEGVSRQMQPVMWVKALLPGVPIKVVSDAIPV